MHTLIRSAIVVSSLILLFGAISKSANTPHTSTLLTPPTFLFEQPTHSASLPHVPLNTATPTPQVQALTFSQNSATSANIQVFKSPLPSVHLSASAAPSLPASKFSYAERQHQYEISARVRTPTQPPLSSPSSE